MSQDIDEDDLNEYLKDVQVEEKAAVKAQEAEINQYLDKPVKTIGTDVDMASGDDDDLSSYVDEDALNPHARQDLIKPWMKFHKFTLIKTVEEVRTLVDQILAYGRCGLDLETEGFDNRIDYDAEGVASTRHKIVGYCLSVRGAGYYIPVRHRFDAPMGDTDPNVPVGQVDAEIRRLCQASQPLLTEEGFKEDPLGSAKMEAPPKVIICFWNSKFDQEFLLPVTGIDFWHPSSFEDGMLAAYSVYSDDNLGLKEHAGRRLKILDPDKQVDGKPAAYPYEMIEFEELFDAKLKRNERKFYDLYPGDDSSLTIYACSDAICTEILCDPNAQKTDWDYAIKPAGAEYKDTLSPVNGKFQFTYRLEKQTVMGVRDMERQRAKIDKGEITVLLDKAHTELAKYDNLIRQMAERSGHKDFNAGSPKQLSEFLFEPSGLNISPKPDKNVSSGQYKTDAATLEAMADQPNAPEVLGWIVKYRQISKIIGTYLTSMSENCDENDALRFKFTQTGAATGRFTAPAGEADHGYAGIPIQGIPARSDPKKPEVAHSLRRIFVARPGYTLVKVDYAGQELRIVANLSAEPKWVNEFLTARSEGREADLHTITAKAFFGDHITKDNKTERNAGKIANFSLIYGGGTQAIMRATKCDKVEAARRKANFDKSVPVFAGWVKGQHGIVKKNHGVSTAFQRFIAIPDATVKAGELDAQGKMVQPEDAKRIQASCERKSTNFPIQGCQKYTSLVQTRDGQVAIGDLCGKESFEVWTGTRWASATAHNMGSCELAEIRLKDGTLIECDTRHKLLVVEDEGYRWVPYAGLMTGMSVAKALHSPLDFSSPQTLPKVRREARSSQTFKVPKDRSGLWYWLGRYVGDGTFNQGVLRYCFGEHEKEAIQKCREFWAQCGLRTQLRTDTHTPHVKASTRHQVSVQSAELYGWLLKLGLQADVTAHTKRLPDRIFRESLTHRKAFLEGVMDSDGHKPRLPNKVNGVWEKTKKGNPYNVHLCQRPLLVDLKRLLRTVGVESTIRGPYRSGTDKKGDDTTSYRLDIQRRMYDQYVGGVANPRLPKFQDMDAPAFLVREFLAKGPYQKAAFKGNESAYTLYLRFKEGGRASVYTLKFLCDLLGVRLRSPIYGFKRLVSKTSLGREEDTYTLSVEDPLHRFESDGVITKNSGADILKISLVKLTKELDRRRWRKICSAGTDRLNRFERVHWGDDSVRMVMTVHDEIVFEVKHERLMDAMPVIIDAMESPSRMVKWKIPLVVEPLLGLNWDAKYDWAEVISGHKIPEWLQGIIVPGQGGSAHPTAEPTSIPPVESKPSAVQTEITPMPLPQARPSTPPPSGVMKGVMRVATFTMTSTYLTEHSINLVLESVAGSLDPDRQAFLCLMDNGGNVLVDPVVYKIPIIPDTFKTKLRDRNLGSGEFELTEQPL